jgi:hypothetical protein
MDTDEMSLEDIRADALKLYGLAHYANHIAGLAQVVHTIEWIGYERRDEYSRAQIHADFVKMAEILGYEVTRK